MVVSANRATTLLHRDIIGLSQSLESVVHVGDLPCTPNMYDRCD